jgi:rod shape-determining protein MreD
LVATALELFAGGSRVRGFWPADWFLIATAIVARGGHFVRSVLAGAAAGFLEDALTQPLLGLNAFAKAAIGYALALVSMRVIFGGTLAVGLALAASSLVNDAIVSLLSSLLLQAPVVLGSRDSILRAIATGTTASLAEAAWKFPWREWREKRRLRRLR